MILVEMVNLQKVNFPESQPKHEITKMLWLAYFTSWVFGDWPFLQVLTFILLKYEQSKKGWVIKETDDEVELLGADVEEGVEVSIVGELWAQQVHDVVLKTYSHSL